MRADRKSLGDIVRLLVILSVPCSVVKGWVQKINLTKVASEGERFAARQRGVKPLSRLVYWVMWPYIQDECKRRGIQPVQRNKEGTMAFIWKGVKKFLGFLANFGQALDRSEKMFQEVPGSWYFMP